MNPRIVWSPLSHHWFVVTRYSEKHGIDVKTGKQTAYIVAQTKYDATDQMTAILSAQKPNKLTRKARTVNAIDPHAQPSGTPTTRD